MTEVVKVCITSLTQDMLVTKPQTAANFMSW
jgi:hypothetical protein